jgi:hypothetical protein
MMHLKLIQKMLYVNFISTLNLDFKLRILLKFISDRAGLLLHLERYHEALAELEELRQIAPKESLVYYLLSKVCYCLKSTTVAKN